MTLETTDREVPNRSSGMTMLVAAIAGALAGMAAAMVIDKRIARRSSGTGPTPLNEGRGLTDFTAEHASGGGHGPPGAPLPGGSHPGGSPSGGHGGSSGGGHGGSSGGGHGGSSGGGHGGHSGGGH